MHVYIGLNHLCNFLDVYIYIDLRGCHDRMVVGFITTYAIRQFLMSFESRSGKMYSIQHYVIKFVSDLLQVSGFLRVAGFLHRYN
jgi:hypothetical protein